MMSFLGKKRRDFLDAIVNKKLFLKKRDLAQEIRI